MKQIIWKRAVNGMIGALSLFVFIGSARVAGQSQISLESL